MVLALLKFNCYVLIALKISISVDYYVYVYPIKIFPYYIVMAKASAVRSEGEEHCTLDKNQS